MSSICVLEHIGLGRYGDKIDAQGTENAIKEIKRVLKPFGNLYISVPVSNQNIVYFNAHRVFSKNYILTLFKNFKLIEEKYIYDGNLCENYDPKHKFGIGLFHFQKLINE